MNNEGKAKIQGHFSEATTNIIVNGTNTLTFFKYSKNNSQIVSHVTITIHDMAVWKDCNGFQHLKLFSAVMAAYNITAQYPWELHLNWTILYPMIRLQ